MKSRDRDRANRDFALDLLSPVDTPDWSLRATMGSPLTWSLKVFGQCFGAVVAQTLFLGQTLQGNRFRSTGTDRWCCRGGTGSSCRTLNSTSTTVSTHDRWPSGKQFRTASHPDCRHAPLINLFNKPSRLLGRAICLEFPSPCLPRSDRCLFAFAGDAKVHHNRRSRPSCACSTGYWLA